MKLLSKLLGRWFTIPRPVLGIPGTPEKVNNPDIYDYNEMERRYLEFRLIRYWSKNKNADGIFEFEPINVRQDTNPFFIDAIKYDTSSRDKCSLMVLVSSASDDKLMFRPHCKEPMPFIEAPCFKTRELRLLVRRLFFKTKE